MTTVTPDLAPDELAKALRLPGGSDYVLRRVRKGEWPCLRYSSRVIRFSPEQVEQIRQLVTVTPTAIQTPDLPPAPRYGRISNANADRRRA